MRTVNTFCALRLGDNLQGVQLLRKLAQRHPEIEFIHYARLCYIPELEPVIQDLPNLRLKNGEFEAPPAGAIDLWKGTGGYWYEHSNRNSYVEFFVDFFDRVAKAMGLENPIRRADDFLFDYPALQQSIKPEWPQFDFLVVNSVPQSNQWQGYNAQDMHRFISRLCERDYSVMTTAETSTRALCTADFAYNTTYIGALSTLCKHIVMVSTGPSWPTFNVFNKDRLETRIILIDHETVNIDRNAIHCNRIDAAARVLEEKGLL